MRAAWQSPRSKKKDVLFMTCKDRNVWSCRAYSARLGMLDEFSFVVKLLGITLFWKNQNLHNK